MESRQLRGTTHDNTNNDLPTDGWDRLSVTYTIPENPDKLRVRFVHGGVGGTAWFAVPQFEQGAIANSVNLVTNADFARFDENMKPADWAAGTHIYATDRVVPIATRPSKYIPDMLPGNYVKFKGKPRSGHSDQRFKQSINISGKKGDVFTAGGWAKAYAMPNSTGAARAFRITVKFKGKDGDWVYARESKQSFLSGTTSWQATGGAISAPKDYTILNLKTHQ